MSKEQNAQIVRRFIEALISAQVNGRLAAGLR